MQTTNFTQNPKNVKDAERSSTKKNSISKKKETNNMKKLSGKTLVKTYKKHIRLYISREQLLKLGIITEDDGFKRYIKVFKKDNRYNDNGLHIVNHIFTEDKGE